MKREYSKQAEKFLKGQPAAVIARIRQAVEKLPAGDVKKLKGFENTYRLRVGTFRILFERSPALIRIRVIDNRGQMYKR